MKKIILLLAIISIINTAWGDNALKNNLLKDANKLFKEGLKEYENNNIRTAIISFKYVLTKLDYIGLQEDSDLYFQTEKMLSASVNLITKRAITNFKKENYLEAYDDFNFLIEQDVLSYEQKENIKKYLIDIVEKSLNKNINLNSLAIKTSKLILNKYRGSVEEEQISAILGNYYYEKAFNYYKTGNYSMFYKLYRDFCEMFGLEFNSEKASEFKDGIIKYFEEVKEREKAEINKKETKEREKMEYDLKLKELEIQKEIAKKIKAINFWNYILQYR